MRLLDLYACAGGAGEGYKRAGFEVIGVDRTRFKRNPHPLIVADVLDLPVEFIRMFDAVHASPPCQGLTELNNDKSRHLNLIPQTRALLEKAGVPYVIENVRAARSELVSPVSLFGTMFDLHLTTSTGKRFNLSRERLFETNWDLRLPAEVGFPAAPIANVFGGHLRARGGDMRTGNGTGRTVDFPGEDRPALARQLMGTPWMSMHEMSECVPPAYTEFIGRQLLRRLQENYA